MSAPESRWSWLLTPTAVLIVLVVGGTVFISMLGKVIRFVAPFL